jgi:hypothetical protein
VATTIAWRLRVTEFLQGLGGAMVELGSLTFRRRR